MTDLRESLDLLDRFVEQQMQVANTPGVAVALTNREQLLHVATYGLADLAAGRAVTADTLFQIGSISKSFTAILLLQLHEAGMVDLHAPVTHHLPWFHVPSDFEPIALHHLLSHTAGVIMGTDLSTEAKYEVWALRETEVITPPGKRFHYSNVGYKALGLVLETLLGQGYGQIVRERILDPLGMEAAEGSISHETRKRLAVGYEPFYDDRPPHRSLPLAPATWFETGTADGCIAATAADLATYLRMLLNRGQGTRSGPQGRILSEEGFRLLTQPAVEYPAEGEEFGSFYGYGLVTGEEEGNSLLGHDGGMVGYYSSMLGDLDDGLGVVVLMNGPGDPDGIARYALRLLSVSAHGRELPPLPAIPDPTHVEKAAEYAGRYRSEDGSFDLIAERERLIMERGGQRITLEQRGEDGFCAPHPDLALFLLRFGRHEGEVVEAFHGPDWYTNERYAGPTTCEYPLEWDAYPGHYRSHNPWYTNFRVVLRKGKLVLIEPWGDEEPMATLGDGVFRVGADPHSPERIRFDTILDGQAIRANLSCCDFYRTFTP